MKATYVCCDCQQVECECNKPDSYVDYDIDHEVRLPSELSDLLVCAFCGAAMRICEETSSGNGYFYGECINRECGIVTPYQNTYEEVKTIITRKAN